MKKSHSFIECLIEAKKYQTKADFYKQAKSYYIIAWRQKWLGLFSVHMLSLSEAMSRAKTKWTYEACLIEAKKYQTRSQFKAGSNQAYHAALYHDWLNQIYTEVGFVSRTGETKTLASKKPSLYECSVEAKKYKNRSEFLLNSPEFYQYAISKRFLNQICMHMKPVNFTIQKNVPAKLVAS